MIVRMLETRLGFCYGTISFPEAAILFSTRLVMVLYFAEIKRLSKIKRLFLTPFVIKVCFNVSNK